MNKNGREEKCVKAVQVGSLIAIKGNYDGQSLVTAAEDGSVKVWSRSGNLRSTLAQTCELPALDFGTVDCFVAGADGIFLRCSATDLLGLLGPRQ